MIRKKRSQALRLLSEHILPGRWADSRQPNESELKADIGPAPADRGILGQGPRWGPLVDDEEDYSFPTWAGVVPLEMITGTPIDDSRLDPALEVPAYAQHITRESDRLPG